ncbi:hypothetical protein PULV_a3511 [Pseudoalteromonas ulvae UL12]|uniref:DUF3083 domain-containing protein n=1 Tax=Pseudoalteromonas ulvae TaxID=107327 RepID=A0A244CTK5_PSEDV|nr:DUF3083 family protein [Pseudoalteromonas ulvae]MBE0363323.1 hypothetical protein [Pseudoalteromonas ulvae UL12]OUL58924.1 hypothetical protein B1199_01175 [Pseudoalteromonas ulvae]
MLQLKKRPSIIHKRSSANKVYVPGNARDNHYLLVSFRPEHVALATTDPRFADNYRQFSEQFFALCQRYELHNTHIIANGKLARVRYGEEQQHIETDEQIIFFYHPAMHTGHHLFVNEAQTVDKIDLLFLASGEQLRETAYLFHQQVMALMAEFALLMNVPLNQIKVKDHQHLTYDLYAHKRGHKQTKTHGLRQLSYRYQEQGLEISPHSQNLTYAITNIPVNLTMRQKIHQEFDEHIRYRDFYQSVITQVTRLCRQYELSHWVLVANGQIPLIRATTQHAESARRELLDIGMDAVQAYQPLIFVDEAQLVDSLSLVFIATDQDLQRNGYGKFVNQLTMMIKELSVSLGLEPERDALILRFFQHLSYKLSA